MSKINKVAATAMIPALILGSNQVAGQGNAVGNALTIYSTAQPGAISPELYRNGGRGQSVETFSGTLLSTSGGMILKRDDGTVQLPPHTAGVTLPGLPGGEVTLRYSVQYTW